MKKNQNVKIFFKNKKKLKKKIKLKLKKCYKFKKICKT